MRPLASRQLGYAPSASGRPLPGVAARPQRPTGVSNVGRLSRFRVVAVLVLAALCVLTAHAQTPAVQVSGTRRLRRDSGAPQPTVPLWLAALTGAAAGATLGVNSVSFSAYPPAVRSARRWRVGASYALVGAGLGAGLQAMFDRTPGAPPARQFWLGRWQTPLLAGMLAAQVLDYTSTRYFRQRGMPEWLLTNGLVDNPTAFIATEALTVAAAIGIAYVLYHTGHPGLARLFEAGYISVGAVSAVANYRFPATGHAIF